MPAFLAQAGAMLVGILASLGAQLLTERFLKSALVQGLAILVKKTETDEDDKLLQEAKKAWGVE
jgi:carbamate kinase